MKKYNNKRILLREIAKLTIKKDEIDKKLRMLLEDYK